MDGALLRTADSPELREHFGSGNTGTDRQTPFPMLRLVALMNVRSHVILDAQLSPYRGSEMRLAETFLGQIPDNSIILFDKCFWGARHRPIQPERLADQHDLDASYLSQILNGHRSLGEKAALNLEQKIGLTPGVLVNPNGRSGDDRARVHPSGCGERGSVGLLSPPGQGYAASNCGYRKARQGRGEGKTQGVGLGAA
ncbi:Transposase [Pseudomonas sp. R2-7-07]|nr:Transposase [Pseudomonas sp. R2-7-07]